MCHKSAHDGGERAKGAVADDGQALVALRQHAEDTAAHAVAMDEDEGLVHTLRQSGLCDGAVCAAER